MRHRSLDEKTVALMGELKREGASYRQLADQFAVGLPTVYYSLNGRKAARQMADNDNHPDRTTRMMPHNGGCSTTSGMMPVTLRRIPTMDTPLLPCVASELVANDNSPVQVAA